MREILNSINRRMAAVATILAVFVSLGMSLSISKMIDLEETYETLDVESTMQVFWRNIFLTFSANRQSVLLMALLLAVIIYLGLTIRRPVGESICLGLIALLFGFFKFACYSYKAEDFLSIQYLFDGETETLIKIRVLWKILAYTIMAYFLLQDAMEIIRLRFVQKEAEWTAKPGASDLFRRAGLIFTAWIPYFLIFYPGTSNEDTTIQLMEYFEIPSYINEMTPVQGDGIYLTNHHPYFLTQLFGHFAEWGLEMGDIQVGIAAYALLQMVFLAFVFAIAVNYLQYLGATKKRCRIVLILFAFLPIFPMYATTLVKDTPYAAYCLLMMIMMWEVERTKGQALQNAWFDLAMFVVAWMMMLTKVYGEYVMAVIFIFYAIKYRRMFLRVVITTLLPVLLFQFVYVSIFLPAKNVAPGGKQEALSIPLQQTARYVIQYGDEVTSEEKKAIDAVIPYDKIEKLYEPELSDKLKRKYNQEVTEEELKTYFKIWLQMGLKHPLCYIDATLNNIYQYFDVNKKSSLAYYQMNTYLQDHPKKYPEAEYSWLYVGNSEEMTDYRYMVNQWILILQKIPGINLFLSLGMLPYIVACMLVLNLSRGRRRYNLAMLIPVLTVAICIMSPDNGNSRYVEPILYSLPFYMALLTLPRENEDAIISLSEG